MATHNAGTAGRAPILRAPIRAVCMDWGGTLMGEDGPEELPMALWPRVEVTPGARECLDALHDRVPLYVATNAAASSRLLIERALERVGFLHHFARVFCFTELGFRKSDAAFWEVVQAELGVAPEQILMVGDSLEQDVLAPRSCGLQAVWLNQGGQRPAPADPVPTVTRLEDLVELLTTVC